MSLLIESIHLFIHTLGFQVALERVVCVEEFSKCRALGRVFLRSMGNTIAVGTITRLIE